MAVAEETTYIQSLLNGQQPGAGLPAHISSLKESAREQIDALPFPTTKHEEWKYTSLKSLTKHNFVAPDAASAADQTDQVKKLFLEEAQKHRLVFVNGRFDSNLSNIEGLPEGAVVGNLADVAKEGHEAIEKNLGQIAQYEDDVFEPFNTYNFEDGAFIYIPSETKIEAPIHLLFVQTSAQQTYYVTPRVLIVGGHHAEATIFEDYVGLDENVYFSAPVTEISLGENAHFTHVKLQQESKKAYHISRIASNIKRDSEYHSYAIHLGSHLSRSDVKAVLQDEGTHCTMDGLVMIRGDQLSDTHSVMDHAKPNCTSHQLHKCIVDDEAHSVFNGKIFVKKHAQKTDAFQENRNLQLSDNSEVYTKPQLEIFADDVSCSHGATIGQVDEEQMFYLKSRGLPVQKAQEVLTYGFALDVIESLPGDKLKERLTKEVQKYARSSKKAEISA